MRYTTAPRMGALAAGFAASLLFLIVLAAALLPDFVWHSLAR